MALYERTFSKFDKSVAQVLLTHEDLANRQRYINAKHTFQVLLESAIIPIVNENDTVAVEEMKFGRQRSFVGAGGNPSGSGFVGGSQRCRGSLR